MVPAQAAPRSIVFNIPNTLPTNDLPRKLVIKPKEGNNEDFYLEDERILSRKLLILENVQATKLNTTIYLLKTTLLVCVHLTCNNGIISNA